MKSTLKLKVIPKSQIKNIKGGSWIAGDGNTCPPPEPKDNPYTSYP